MSKSGQKRSNIKIGAEVEIVEKHNQRTGEPLPYLVLSPNI